MGGECYRQMTNHLVHASCGFCRLQYDEKKIVTIVIFVGKLKVILGMPEALFIFVFTGKGDDTLPFKVLTSFVAYVCVGLLKDASLS